MLHSGIRVLSGCGDHAVPAILGPARYRDSSVFAGAKVRISDDLRKAVVFLAVQDDTPGLDGIRCIGTAFLIAYDGCKYLVTAKHVATPLEGAPYAIRINRKDRSFIVIAAVILPSRQKAALWELA